jgi:twitching motility two-component system response regulator PilG
LKWCRFELLYEKRVVTSAFTASHNPEEKVLSVSPSGFKVLVIDDSNTIRRSAEIFLKQGGHEVLLAEDGFDALAKVNDFLPNLIFCDILMPRLDGYQTCAIIKRNDRFAATPIVMLSSKDGVFDKARGRMVGSQDYLTKPFTKDQLLQAVLNFGTTAQGV